MVAMDNGGKMKPERTIAEIKPTAPHKRPHIDEHKLELLKKLAHVQRKRQRRQIRRFIVGLLVICLLCIGAWQGYNKYKTYFFQNQVPAEIRDSVTFPLYLPEVLPKGYSLNKSSFDGNPIVFTYYIESPKGQKLIFTQQPKPAEINTEQFGKERLYESKEITLPIGKASIGSIKDVTTASITSEETWIIITAPQGINGKDLRTILRELKKL